MPGRFPTSVDAHDPLGAPYSLKVHQLELMGVAETSARVLDGGYTAVTLDTYSHAAPGLTVPSVHRERK